MPKNLLYMWAYPRMVARFVCTILLILLARLPFWLFNAQIIPYYLEFNPGIVLVPLAGVFWGPAGVLGCAAASLIGDSLFGLWGPMAGYRAMGYFMFALSANRLWDAFPYRVESFPGHAPKWTPTVRFVFMSLPGCFMAASWTALGSEMLRLYPFTYYMVLLLGVNLIFVPLLGIALYRIMAREMVPYFGTWRDIMRKNAIPRPLTGLGVLFIVVGGVGACVAGYLASGWGYGVWPFKSVHILGTTAGKGVIWWMTPFLILQWIGFFIRGREREPSAAQKQKPVQMDLGVERHKTV